ncbi:MAG: NAD-dependent dehydratase [Luteimonas sp.]|nr:NAD-dependent dehydratase [Luteimonas sp.]
MKLILAGATGLVGRHVLALALADPRVLAVVAPTRRALPGHPKLLAPVVDFDRLPVDAAWWHADAIACALGTTIKAARSREAFRRVDLEYPLAIARLARHHGTPACVLNSAKGADPGSRIFYSRTKGELEQALAGVGFDSLTFVRPGLIGGKREEHRTGERIAGAVLGALHPLLPRGWRINPADRIAYALLEAAILARPGIHSIDSAALT